MFTDRVRVNPYAVNKSYMKNSIPYSEKTHLPNTVDKSCMKNRVPYSGKTHLFFYLLRTMAAILTFRFHLQLIKIILNIYRRWVQAQTHYNLNDKQQKNARLSKYLPYICYIVLPLRALMYPPFCKVGNWWVYLHSACICEKQVGTISGNVYMYILVPW